MISLRVRPVCSAISSSFSSSSFGSLTDTTDDSPRNLLDDITSFLSCITVTPLQSFFYISNCITFVVCCQLFICILRTPDENCRFLRKRKSHTENPCGFSCYIIWSFCKAGRRLRKRGSRLLPCCPYRRGSRMRDGRSFRRERCASKRGCGASSRA